MDVCSSSSSPYLLAPTSQTTTRASSAVREMNLLPATGKKWSSAGEIKSQLYLIIYLHSVFSPSPLCSHLSVVLWSLTAGVRNRSGLQAKSRSSLKKPAPLSTFLSSSYLSNIFFWFHAYRMYKRSNKHVKTKRNGG